MMQRKCNDPNATQSPFGQLKLPLNIPSDPRQKCKGFCGEPIDKSKNAQIPKKTVGKPHQQRAKNAQNKKYDSPANEPEKLSSSESGLNFLQVASTKDDGTRPVHFREHHGTSFGAHLLRKSVPLLSDALDRKLRFKRDSDAPTFALQDGRKISQPFFINEVDLDDVAQLRGKGLIVEDSTCPPPPPMKRNMVDNQFLTTNSRAKEGLKYVMATNFPHLPPDAPTDGSLIKHEITDVCGRRSHHPRLRARELGKRLCEAPSMTKELDDLYSEYTQRCPGGAELSEACRWLHHAPSPHHRETRRSILKDPRASALELHHPRNSGKNHLVHFDKEVDVTTAFNKVDGIDRSLRETDGRLKLLRQLGSRIPASKSHRDPLDESYPLHVRDPKKFTPQGPLGLDSLKNLERDATEEQDLEEKTAKQDLARIYFTTEATRVVACANLAALERKTNMFKKSDTSRRRPPFPHFFMDRLTDDLDKENKQKKKDKIVSIKNEMDAFDASVQERPPPVNRYSNFDPLQMPSDKSLNDMKLKIEIMRKQRERDVQAAATRNRTRKSYFRKMLPCFADVIRDDLLEYSIKRASKLSGEEMILAGDLLMVANQRNVLEEHIRKYEEEKEEFSTEEEEHEGLGRHEKMMRDILEVCIDVVVKISNYKATTGEEPSESLRREWRETGFSVLNQLDANDGQLSEIFEEPVCRGEEEEEEEDDQAQLRRQSEMSEETTDEMKEPSVSTHGEDDAHMRCLISINTVREPTNGRMSLEERPVTTVQVQVTDCLNEDIDNAMTFDGLFLPVTTDSQLSQSSSATQTASSSSSVTPSVSHEESFTDCARAQQLDAAKEMADYEYEEYEGEGENEEYFDDHGETVAPVGNSLRNSAGRNENEVTEEPATETDETVRVGEVEVQAIDFSEGDSPDAAKPKTKGLQFSEVVDKKADDAESTANLTKSGVSLKEKDSIKFSLPDNFLSKRNPVQRKQTAFHSRHSFDDDDDDDMDDDDDNYAADYKMDKEEVTTEDRQLGELAHTTVWEETTGIIDEEEDINAAEEEGEGKETGSSDHTGHTKPGPSKRKVLVYEELGNISYGMNCIEHEKRFLEHRCNELRQYSLTWGKGLHKPPTVYTVREKNFVPYSNRLTGKRMPPFNILDPYIPRPTFNLRIKHLIRKVEQAKLEQNKCQEVKLEQDAPENNERSQTVVKESTKRTCADTLKGKPKKRPAWQDEIAEYECRRKEREKLLAETEVVEDYAKSLGFDEFYKNASLRATFIRHGSHVHIEDDPSTAQTVAEESGTRRKSSLGKNNPTICVPDPDSVLSDVCLPMEEEADNSLKDTNVVSCVEEEECVSLFTKYLEIPGEGLYDGNFEFPSEKKYEVDEDTYSIQEAYNE